MSIPGTRDFHHGLLGVPIPGNLDHPLLQIRRRVTSTSAPTQTRTRP